MLSGGISAATATLDERRVLLKFSMTDETSGRPKLTIHEMPETETDNR